MTIFMTILYSLIASIILIAVLIALVESLSTRYVGWVNDVEGDTISCTIQSHGECHYFEIDREKFVSYFDKPLPDDLLGVLFKMRVNPWPMRKITMSLPPPWSKKEIEQARESTRRFSDLFN